MQGGAAGSGSGNARPQGGVGGPADGSAWTAGFLRDALADGLIDRPTYDRLLRALAAKGVGLVPASLPVPAMPDVPLGGRVQHVAVRPTKPVARSSPRPDTWTVEPKPAPRLAPTRRPAPIAVWFARVRDAVVSDVTVHGLAYLGVLLVFAGTLGFLLFSFGELARPARPWAELAVPTVLLGSAAFLRRRGAPMVANALGVVGGLLLPIVLFASFVDGEPFPPELHDDALGVGVAITSVALATAYALIARRWRDVSVRFLVAPMLWTALWGIGMLLPNGTLSLREWTAAQFALFTVGVSVTAIAVAAQPRRWLSVDARPSLLPGLVVGFGTTLLLGAAEGWPVWPVVVASLGALVTTEALDERLPRALVQAAQPVLLWTAILALRGGVSEETLAPIAVASSIVLLEWQARRRPGVIPLVAGGLGAATGLWLGVVAGSMTWGFVAAAAEVAAWAHVRRVLPVAGIETPEQRAALGAWIAAIAVAAPVAAAAGAVALLPGAGGYLVVAGLLTVLAVLVRIGLPRDAFLAWCVAGWAVLLAVASLAVVDTVSTRALAGSVALAAVTIAITRIPSWLRMWTVPVVVATAGGLLAWDLGWTTARMGLALAVAGSVLAASAGWAPRRSLGNLSAAGWLLGLTGVVAAGEPTITWMSGIAVSSLTLATVVLTAAELVGEGRGPMPLARAHVVDPTLIPATRVVGPVVSAMGLTATLLVWCDVGGLTESDPGAVTVLLALLGATLAGATWPLRRWSVLDQVAADSGVLLTVLAAGLAVPWERASIATLAMTVGACAVVVPTTRRLVTPWIGWIAATALIGRVATASGAAPRMVALVLAVWAAAIVIWALAQDDAIAGRRAYGQLVRVAWLWPPAVVGAVVFPLALVAGMGRTDLRIALVAVFGAVVFGLVAWLLRAGSITVVSYLLVSLGAAVLSPYPPEEEPWVLLPWAAALFVVAWALEAPPGTRPLGARWDLPAFGVAVAALAAGVYGGAATGTIASTWTVAGVLTLAVAWYRRWPLVAATGGLLVFGGAYDAGHAWSAAVSLVGAAILAAVPARVSPANGPARVGLRALAATLATFALIEAWLFVDGTTTELVVTMLALAGVGTLAATWLAARADRSDAAAQVALVALATQLVGSAAAWTLWPQREPLVAALLLATLEAAAAGFVLRRVGPTLASPVFACAAWLLAAGDLLAGDPMWWTIPVGLMFLVQAAILRAWWGSHEVVRDREPVDRWLEWAGMLTMLAVPLIQIVAIAPARGLVAIGMGLLFAMWGIATRVRRRLFVGVMAVVLALVLMVVGPIAGFVRQIQGAAVWVLLAVAGIVLILIATSLERGRARLSDAMQRLDELLNGWE
jgi:hypothetical protein